MIRLLVVSYYFPPAGGSGVQRVLKWVKYLRDFGVEPVVLSVEAGAYPKHDGSLLRDVPESVEVYRTTALDPFGLYARLTGRTRQAAVTAATGRISDDTSAPERLARWARANVFIPDARVGWIPFAVREGVRVMRGAPVDAILTSGPPHSTHLVGRSLARRTGVPWVADFRDPWTGIHYNRSLPRTALARRIDRGLEQSVLAEADAVTTVSPTLKRLLHGLVPGRPEAFCTVIYNGYDPEDFDETQGAPRSDMFTLSYVGTLYESPSGLWAAIAGLRAQGETPRLRVRIVGRSPAETAADVEPHGLTDVVEIVPYVTHDEAVQEIASASALLLTVEDWPDADMIMPGKMYEYLAAGRPILGLGPERGDAAAVLNQTASGRMIERDAVQHIAAFLLEHYGAWERGERTRAGTGLSVSRFSRRAQAGELAALVSGLVENEPRR